MMIAERPADEAERLLALRSSRILGSDPEAVYDNIASYAARVAETPTAVIMMIDEDYQWVKARYGFDGEDKSPRDIAFCSHTIAAGGPFIVEDAQLDERFHDNPFVTGPVNIRFYAGFPIHGPQGHAFGTICVIDSEPRRLEDGQIEVLAMLAKQIEAQLELRSAAVALDRLADAKTTMLNALKHEATTTYEGIMSAHRYLARTDLDAEQQAYLDFSVDSTHHLVVLLEYLTQQLEQH